MPGTRNHYSRVRLLTVAAAITGLPLGASAPAMAATAPIAVSGPQCTLSVGKPVADGDKQAKYQQTYYDYSKVSATVSCRSDQSSIVVVPSFHYKTYKGATFINASIQLGAPTICTNVSTCKGSVVKSRLLSCGAVYTFYDFGSATASASGVSLPYTEGNQRVGSSFDPEGSACPE